MGISHVLGVNTHPKVSRKIYFSSKGEKFPPKAPTEPQANDFFFFFLSSFVSNFRQVQLL